MVSILRHFPVLKNKSVLISENVLICKKYTFHEIKENLL